MPADLARGRYASARGLARRMLRGEEKLAATISGRPAPLLGRLAMDWCCVDLTDVPEANVAGNHAGGPGAGALRQRPGPGAADAAGGREAGGDDLRPPGAAAGAPRHGLVLRGPDGD